MSTPEVYPLAEEARLPRHGLLRRGIQRFKRWISGKKYDSYGTLFEETLYTIDGHQERLEAERALVLLNQNPDKAGQPFASATEFDRKLDAIAYYIGPLSPEEQQQCDDVRRQIAETEMRRMSMNSGSYLNQG